MTSDTNAPREALAKAMRNATGDSYPSNCICYRGGPSWGEYLEDADAVIRYLWQCAEDPEVVEAVDSICIVHGMSRTESEGLIETVLTALIGPRPSGEEAADER